MEPLIPAFDIVISTPDPACAVAGFCLGIQCIALAIMSTNPGGFSSALCEIHETQCTEAGPTATFHVETTTDILGVCVRQLYSDGTAGPCADLFTQSGGGGNKDPPMRR